MNTPLFQSMEFKLAMTMSVAWQIQQFRLQIRVTVILKAIHCHNQMKSSE